MRAHHRWIVVGFAATLGFVSFHGKSLAQSYPGEQVTVGALPVSVAIGDVNGDGRLDVVTANQVASTISVALSNGAAGFLASTSFPVGASPLSVAIGDVNGDGKKDVVTSNFNANSVSVLIGNGLGGSPRR